MTAEGLYQLLRARQWVRTCTVPHRRRMRQIKLGRERVRLRRGVELALLFGGAVGCDSLALFKCRVNTRCIWMERVEYRPLKDSMFAFRVRVVVGRRDRLRS